MFVAKVSQGVKSLFKNRNLKEAQIGKNHTAPSYTDMEVTIIATRRSFKNIVFSRCVFVRQNFTEVTFTDCYFIECSFTACKFNNVEFHDSYFINCLFQKPSFSQTYLDPKFLRYRFSQWKRDAPNINTTLFQRLEANLRDIYQDDFAQRAHIQFRRYRRWQDLYRTGKNIGLFRKIGLAFRFLCDFAYEATLLYGYGLYRALVLTVLIFYLGTVGVDYYWDELKLVSNTSSLVLNQSNSLQKLYFLVVTASTLGYGDVTPMNDNGMRFVIGLLIFSVIWTATLTALIVKRLVK